MTRAYEYITRYTSPNQNARNQSIKGITIHWWGNPVGQKIGGIVSWLCDKRAGTSAHYVVSDGIVYCIVDPDRRAWHAGNSAANHHQIGIELDPNASQRAGTQRTAAALIADLRAVYGDLPLSPHRRWTSTACPGNWDLAALDRAARGATAPAIPSGGTSVPVPSAPALTRDGTLTVDGRQGVESSKALQRFLNSRVKARTLKVDGRLGPETYLSLQEYLEAPYLDGEISRQSYRPTELGNGIGPHGWDYTGRGSDGSQTVQLLQAWVGVAQDGIWYEGTSEALQRKLNDHAVGM